MSEMDYTYYGFTHCVGGFFEMSTADAKGLLPSHLQPLERQHGRSIFAITVFHFDRSEVGTYNEVVLGIIVPPMVEPGKPLPKAAFYPFMVGTDTPESRAHAIERWHLPHYMEDLTFDCRESEDRMEVKVTDQGRPVLDLTVTDFGAHPAKNLYNCFMADADGRYKVNIFMEGPHSEHEEEEGHLKLYEHPMTAGIDFSELSPTPFREEWYRQGMQTFEPLETL